MKRIDAYWYSNNAVSLWLRPVAGIYLALVVIRRVLYKLRLLRSYRPAVPVIVVGNITVGGTGKTPLVIWLANQLKARGYRLGIVSRGYGGQARTWPQQVRADSDPKVVGDEAVLIAQQSNCPMAVGPDRVKAVMALLEQNSVDLLITDDGLQHYALRRDIEIAVVDGVRRFGNRHCLPAGPLREPMWRLGSVDHVVVKGLAGHGEYAMDYVPGELTNLKAPSVTCTWDSLKAGPVHLVAGIGHPNHFFLQVTKQGVEGIEHVFDDHHKFTPEDLDFGDNFPVLMTEKDSVKCRSFARDDHWFMPIKAKVDDKLVDEILQKMEIKKRG